MAGTGPEDSTVNTSLAVNDGRSRPSGKTVNYVVRVPFISRHRPVRSNAKDEDAWPGSWNFETCDGAMFVAHKSVIRIVTVNPPACDVAVAVDSKRVSTFEGTWNCAGAGNV